MRQVVKRVADIRLGEDGTAQLASEHQRGDPGDLGLEREDLQIHRPLQVLLESSAARPTALPAASGHRETGGTPRAESAARSPARRRGTGSGGRGPTPADPAGASRPDPSPNPGCCAVCCRRPRRSALVRSPNSFSKTRRGLFSIGSGEDGDCHEMELRYAQLNDASHASTASSMVSSSEGSGVSCPMCCAAT